MQRTRNSSVRGLLEIKAMTSVERLPFSPMNLKKCAYPQLCRRFAPRVFASAWPSPANHNRNFKLTVLCKTLLRKTLLVLKK